MKLYAFLPFILQTIAWPIAHLILRINGKFIVHGKENLKGLKGPVIFAANHVNDLDPVITRAILPMFSILAPVFWVALYRKDYDKHAEEPFKGWRGLLYGDWFFRSWGAHPAIKGTGDYEQSLQNHIQLLKDKQTVCIFPQGGKAKYYGAEAPVRGGVAFLSHHSGAPIVPIAISGTKGMTPYRLFVQKTHVEVHILPPVIIGGDVVDYKEEAQKIMDSIYKNFL